jgi:hypothetical protein
MDIRASLPPMGAARKLMACSVKVKLMVVVTMTIENALKTYTQNSSKCFKNGAEASIRPLAL